MFDNTGGQSFGIGKFPPNDLQTQVIVEGFSPSCLVRKFTEATWNMTLDQNKKTTLCFDHAKFADSPNSVVQSEIAVQPNQNDVSSCKGKSQILSPKYGNNR